jgi:SAM-dependent methyltransferase
MGAKMRLANLKDPEIAKKEDFKNEHAHYPDIMPEGIEKYPFVESRINPIFYEIPDGSKVLDVGCNSGEFLNLLKTKKRCDVTGADISEEMVAAANAKGILAVRCDADKLPFPDASFDVVTLMEVLEHFHEPVPYLKEIRRVLRPDGILLGSCPHANLERYIWDDERLHHQYYTELGIKADMEQAFDEVYLRILNGTEFNFFSFSKSHLANEPCEILFKAGGKNCQPWDQQLRESKLMRVWFGPTQAAATAYYRMLGFAENMDKLGLIQSAYERCPWDQMDERIQSWQKRIRQKLILNQLEAILRMADISIWQVVMNRDVLSFLRCAKDLANNVWAKTMSKKWFVMDIDDDFFNIPSGNMGSHPYQPNSELEWVAQKQVEMSDALICSTQWLADKMKIMFPEKPVFIVPNSIDFEVWDNLDVTQFESKKPGMIRIGYTGCSNHRKDLEMIREPICAILQEFENVEFLFTPQPEPEGMFNGWQGIPRMGVIREWATIDKYPAFIKSWRMDIGIAPLRDNDFNRAKSNLRWLEYSALRVPTVASMVYPFKNSIKDGEDGIIANTSQQWYDALKSLITDESKRRTIGEAAYARVKADYNMELTAKRYAKILEDIRCNEATSRQKSLAS